MKSYREENAKFYHSKAWKQTREAYISARMLKDGGQCERCKKRPGFIVHHKEYLDEAKAKDADIALNLNNLEYLCKPCHDEEHFTKRRKGPAIAFDKTGQPIPLGDR